MRSVSIKEVVRCKAERCHIEIEEAIETWRISYQDNWDITPMQNVKFQNIIKKVKYKFKT